MQQEQIVMLPSTNKLAISAPNIMSIFQNINTSKNFMPLTMTLSNPYACIAKKERILLGMNVRRMASTHCMYKLKRIQGIYMYPHMYHNIAHCIPASFLSSVCTLYHKIKNLASSTNKKSIDKVSIIGSFPQGATCRGLLAIFIGYVYLILS